MTRSRIEKLSEVAITESSVYKCWERRSLVSRDGGEERITKATQNHVTEGFKSSKELDSRMSNPGYHIESLRLLA